jgi:hypothetical protein
MTLVFVTMFVVIFGALTGLVTRSYHQAVLQAQDELAFHIAEAGLNYGRWRLAHAPNSLTSETRDVTDQFAGVLGSYTLTFTAPVSGSTIVLITSEGKTAAQPTRAVRVRARYGIPSLAKYAAITNMDVWYTSEIKGVVHANGGIRMDGESDSLMTSAKATYTCQPNHGCNPAQTKPGIWGSGERAELWEFPVAAIDYNELSSDLVSLKQQAQSTNTYYGPSGVFGYHLVFNSNNTYSLYRVTRKGSLVCSWFPEGRQNVSGCPTSSTGTWERNSYDIDTQVLVETKAVPANGVIFTEDTLWLNGSVMGRVTVAAGRFPDAPSTNADIILNGDITYSDVRDGSRALGVIAQRHALIPWSAAEDRLELDGAFIAQKGRFGRRYYCPSGCNASPHILKSKLELYGMIASNLSPATAWGDGSGQVISGYRERELTYDPYLLYQPPPHFPTTGNYEFISWEELLPGEN